MPLHEYVYEPEPPDGFAVHVTGLPTYTLEGAAEHELATGFVTVTVA